MGSKLVESTILSNTMSDSDPDKDYICTLDEASVKKAKEELNEDPKERLSAVKTLRKWALEQEHIKTRTDTEFLLRFLRVTKFSQLKARTHLEGFCELVCDIAPEWFEDVDPAAKSIQSVIDTGYIVPIPERDEKGRKIVLCQVGAYDPSCKDYKNLDLMRLGFLLGETCNGDENTMVNGYVYFIDFTGFTAKHLTYYGMDMIVKESKHAFGKYPGRFKEIHYFNTGPVFETMFNVIRVFLPEKMKKRIFIHDNNMEHVYKHIPKKYLPREYLPDEYDGPCPGTIKELTDKMKQDLMNKREYFVNNFKKGVFEYDIKKKPVDGEVASFRKLNVD